MNIPNIQYFSDFHLEYTENQLPEVIPECKYIIIAGDLCPVRSKKFETFIKKIPDNINVIFVPGNHEYYGQTLEWCHWKLQHLDEKYSHFHYLQNSFIEFDDYMFIGTTLWFDPYIGDCPHLNDFDQIKHFNYIKCAELYKKSVDFLKTTLKTKIETKIKSVVITHHCPILSKSNPIYKNESGFSNDLSELIKTYTHKIDYWIYGHLHWNQVTCIGQTMVGSNCIELV